MFSIFRSFVYRCNLRPICWISQDLHQTSISTINWYLATERQCSEGCCWIHLWAVFSFVLCIELRVKPSWSGILGRVRIVLCVFRKLRWCWGWMWFGCSCGWPVLQLSIDWFFPKPSLFLNALYILNFTLAGCAFELSHLIVLKSWFRVDIWDDARNSIDFIYLKNPVSQYLASA